MALDDRCAAFAREIAKGSTVGNAATALGIAERTAWRWMARPDVRVEVERIRERSTALLADRLADLAGLAVTTLRAVLADESAGPVARVGAIRVALDQSLRHREAAEMERRIDALEAAVERGLAARVG